MSKEKQIQQMAKNLEGFWNVFDAIFLLNENWEKTLKEVQESLEQKRSHNLSALVVIMAAGGNYEPEEDTAHIDEVKALISLIKARKNVRDVAIQKAKNESVNAQALEMFLR